MPSPQPVPSPPRSRLQEAEQQSRGLRQELAALREELQARGPVGKWPSACPSWSKSPTRASGFPRGVPRQPRGTVEMRVLDSAAHLALCRPALTEHPLYAYPPGPAVISPFY